MQTFARIILLAQPLERIALGVSAFHRQFSERFE